MLASVCVCWQVFVFSVFVLVCLCVLVCVCVLVCMFVFCSAEVCFVSLL